ncbi:LPS export ABC transporter periplasmic protein LptC [Alloyangia pacifica]|uniref:LPS export ABC transporter periplasmic protein LptC n=1 Tax=Alloyangia pacifica TaxID=311180 RepID=UPI001CD65001|nr:LPS export ABC transporter periplasmic protein LptC [Alloyangia pacifica]MCA0996025.1 hypothetical protein [Alloyangia pacifica]
MAQRRDSYSSFIAWLKILLPLVALVSLSTLFLLSRGSQTSQSIPYAEGSLPEREQVAAPQYSGTTPRGDSVTMTAESARPTAGNNGEVEADGFFATMDMADGSRLTLDANLATMSDGMQAALLQQGVRITSSTGYVITTDEMRAALDRIEAETLAPVSGEGPAGRFTAGRLKITSSGEEDDVQLLFTDGVKLIYDPKKE